MLHVAVAVSPPLLADTLSRLLVGRNLDVTLVRTHTPERFDVALVDTAGPIPPATVTLILPRTLRGLRPVLVRDSGGARFETFDGIDGIIDWVSSQPVPDGGR